MSVHAVRMDSQSPQATDVCRLTQSWWPAVSPDGTRVAYKNDDGLVVVDCATSKEVLRLPLPGSGLCGWSPDGKQIGFGARESAEKDSFWILRLADNRLIRVADGPYTISAWSNDGSKLAFDLRHEEKGLFEVWIAETKVLETLKPER